MTRRGDPELRQPGGVWRVSHVDIAGGIIETPEGDYEITRVIGRDVGLERVRADIRLMAVAPMLVDAAARLRDLWEERRSSEPQAVDKAFADGMEVLGRLLRDALDPAEAN